MKTNLVLSAIAAASIAVFAQAASAQGANENKPTKSGSLAPAGVGPIASTPSTMSDKTRMERKDTTKADRKAGELRSAGDGAGERMDDKADKMKPSTTTRAERKATTKAAVKSGTVQPAGEAATPSAEPAKK